MAEKLPIASPFVLFVLLRQCAPYRHLSLDVSEYLVELLLHLLNIVTVFILQEYLR